MAIGIYISIITLNVNGLNTPTKRQRLAEWIQKQDPYVCCLQDTHFRPKERHIKTESERLKNIFHANGKSKEGWNSNPYIRQKNRPKINNITGYISPMNVCGKAGLMVLNSLNFCFSVKLLISPSILNDILAG